MPNASFDFFHHYYGSPIPFFQMAAVFFHHYYGTQDRFGQISPSLSTQQECAVCQKWAQKKRHGLSKNLWRCSLIDIQFSFP